MENRIITAIGKHVIAQQALSGGGKGIGIDESAEAGIVIAGLEVVQAGFGVPDIATVAQGIIEADGVLLAAGDGEDTAPCVVGVADFYSFIVYFL